MGILETRPDPLELPQLELPQRLFGRENACQRVAAAFDTCVSAQGVALALVHGPSGCGKSALLHAALPGIARRGGWLMLGSHDALHHGTPFGAIACAMTQWVSRVAAQPSDVQARLRRRLQALAGDLGGILTDTAPALLSLLGPQKPVPALGLQETENRLLMLWRDVIAALCQEQPWVLWIDDLHRADAGTLRLFELLSRQTNLGGGLLLVGAYDSDELGNNHAPMRCLERLHACQGVIDISLTNLTWEEVQPFLKAWSRASDVDIAPWAQYLFAQTNGNPLFLHALLAHLKTQGWDLSQLQPAPAFADVATLMLQRLNTLPPQDLNLVCHAAHVGITFDLDFLRQVHGCSRDEAAARLQSALRLGLVVSLTPEGNAHSEPEMRYQFTHERVRQSAYGMLSRDASEQVHSRLGTLLLQRMQSHHDVSLFDALSHLNCLEHAVSAALSEQQLADLNLAAASEAHQRAAHDIALMHLNMAMVWAPQDIVRSSPAWYHACALELAKNAFVAGHIADAFAKLDRLLETATAPRGTRGGAIAASGYFIGSNAVSHRPRGMQSRIASAWFWGPFDPRMGASQACLRHLERSVVAALGTLVDLAGVRRRACAFGSPVAQRLH